MKTRTARWRTLILYVLFLRLGHGRVSDWLLPQDDHGEGDEDEEEEEEEEEEDGGKRSHAHGRTRGVLPHSPTMSPPSSAPPRTPRDALSPARDSLPAQKVQPTSGNSRVKVVRQWVPSRGVAAH